MKTRKSQVRKLPGRNNDVHHNHLKVVLVGLIGVDVMSGVNSICLDGSSMGASLQVEYVDLGVCLVTKPANALNCNLK